MRLAFVCKICGTQTCVDVLATQTACQRSGQIQLFSRAVWAGQGANGLCTVLCFHSLQTIRHIFECGLPIDFFPLAALLQHGLGQTLVAVQSFVAETVAVSDPAFVDLFVLQRHHAHDFVVFHLHDQVGASGVMWADRFATAQFPGACAVTERLAGQRAHGANVNHVA